MCLVPEFDSDLLVFASFSCERCLDCRIIEKLDLIMTWSFLDYILGNYLAGFSLGNNFCNLFRFDT